MLPGNEIVLHATTVLGGLEIMVPPEMRVIDNGVAILGGREVAGDSAESSGRGAPVLRIEGPCVLAGVEVKRKPRQSDRPDRFGPPGDLGPAGSGPIRHSGTTCPDGAGPAASGARPGPAAAPRAAPRLAGDDYE